MLDAIQPLDVEAACWAVLQGLGRALLVGSTLAALTWALTRVLRKRITPAMEVALWCIVLLRFIIPGGPDWSGSLASLCTRLVPGSPRIAEKTELLAPLSMVDSPLPGNANALAAGPPASLRPGWAALAVATYVAALVALAGLRVVSYRRFRTTYAALPEPDANLRRMLCGVCDRMGVRRPPLIRISDDHRAPFVMGIFRPLLVLSRHHLARPDHLETVLVHELTHLRRGDMLVRCLQCLAGLLFFFWPVVAWVNRRIDKARECACDECAVRRGKLSPGQYARCLLEAARWRRLSRGTYAPACMAGQPSTIERRIDRILALPDRAPRGVAGRLTAGALLAIWCCFSLAGTPAPATHVNVKYPATSDGMLKHAQLLYEHVKTLPGGDIDGNGKVTKEECWAYVTAVILAEPEEVLKAYPQVDRNRNQRLDFDEAFFLVCGNYDLEELQAKFSPELKRAAQAGDTQREKDLTSKLETAGYATWHLILDRRAQFIAQAKALPAPELARSIYEKDMPAALANAQFEHCVQGVKEVARLKDEAAKLWAQAAAGPDNMKLLEAKAAQLKSEASSMISNLQAEINSRLAELDERQPDEAARYRGLLEKLESL